jgi:hypothetical protein
MRNERKQCSGVWTETVSKQSRRTLSCIGAEHFSERSIGPKEV